MIPHSVVERRQQELRAILDYLGQHAAHAGCEHAHRTALLCLIDVVGGILLASDYSRSMMHRDQDSLTAVDVAFERMRHNVDPIDGEEIDQFCDARHVAINSPCMRRSGHAGGHLSPNGYTWF